MTAPITRREWRNVILFALLIISSFVLSFRADAQETKSEELLYRLDDKLYLTNIVTGTTVMLPEISAPGSNSFDWLWSPDGRFLLGDFTRSDSTEKLIRIYDVDNRRWIHDIQVDTTIIYMAWSSDSSQIAYAKPISYDKLQSDGQLWVFDLKTNKQRLLYQTKVTGDRVMTDTGIEGIWWSPDNHSLLFEEYVYNFAFGYSDVGLNLISIDSKNVKEMASPWRGGFNPIWSPDSKWFLLDLPDTFYFPVDPNDLGDVILYGVNERIFGLTNTPDVRETNLKWLENGKEIQFEANKQLITIELQDVINNPKSFKQQTSPLPTKPERLGDRDIPSPDGKWVAYLIYQVNNTSDLYVARPNGSQSSKLVAGINFLGWRPA